MKKLLPIFLTLAIVSTSCKDEPETNFISVRGDWVLVNYTTPTFLGYFVRPFGENPSFLGESFYELKFSGDTYERNLDFGSQTLYDDGTYSRWENDIILNPEAGNILETVVPQRYTINGKTNDHLWLLGTITWDVFDLDFLEKVFAVRDTFSTEDAYFDYIELNAQPTQMEVSFQFERQ